MKTSRFHAAILGAILFILLRAVIAKGNRWSGLFKRICVVGTAWRQNVELSVLILAQAVARGREPIFAGSTGSQPVARLQLLAFLSQQECLAL